MIIYIQKRSFARTSAGITGSGQSWKTLWKERGVCAGVDFSNAEAQVWLNVPAPFKHLSEMIEPFLSRSVEKTGRPTRI
jgi:hypothetical protein